MQELLALPATTNASPYHIQLDVFEGPLDLLLHLIRENQIDIYNIPIGFITAQYLQTIELMQELNLDVAGEFLVMAATLAHLKSKMLLPPDKTEGDEDEEQGQDPREELVRRLLEYQKYKHVGEQLLARPTLDHDVFVRPASRQVHYLAPQQQELAQISVFKLVDAFGRILKKLLEENRFHQVQLEPLAIADGVQAIRQALKLSQEGTVKFSALFRGVTSRMRLVVTFLALLDLIKRGYIRVFQAGNYSDIEVMGTSQIYGDWKYEGTDEYRA